MILEVVEVVESWFGIIVAYYLFGMVVSSFLSLPSKAEKPAKKGPGQKEKKDKRGDGEDQEDPLTDIFN